jgi:hypothetical protein
MTVHLLCAPASHLNTWHAFMVFTLLLLLLLLSVLPEWLPSPAGRLPPTAARRLPTPTGVTSHKPSISLWYFMQGLVLHSPQQWSCAVLCCGVTVQLLSSAFALLSEP